MLFLHNRRPQSYRTGNRHGATVVEFAMVAPLFVLFLVSSFEFSRLNVIRHSTNNAAYEAARHIIVPGATASEAVEKANQVLAIVGARGGRVTINPPIIDRSVQEVTVTVEVPVAQNGWIVPRFSRSAIMRAQSTMKTERAG